jgi:hypothetical protein
MRQGKTILATPEESVEKLAEENPQIVRLMEEP